MSKYNLYLGEILRSIEIIEKYNLNTKINYNKFLKDTLLFDATSMRLQIIGESLNSLSKKILGEIKDVDVRRFLQTRNIVSHAYFAIKPEIIWYIAVKDIPKLKKEIIKIKKELNKKGETRSRKLNQKMKGGKL